MEVYISQDVVLMFFIFYIIVYHVYPYMGFDIENRFDVLHKNAHDVDIDSDEIGIEGFTYDSKIKKEEPESRLLNNFEHPENIEKKEDGDDDVIEKIQSDITTTELLNISKNVKDGCLCQGMYAPISDFENNALERQLNNSSFNY